MRLRLGTRGSELARAQSGHVADALVALGHEVELVLIRSEGDVCAGSLRDAGGLGVFAAALRCAILAGDVDFAVHSLKDLPTSEVPGLVLAAIPPREDPSDVLCARDGHTLASLPSGARVGTGSPRRAAQLRARRPDLVVVEIRGNVGTRLARVLGSTTTDADLDAVVLAHAGLARLGRLHAATDHLDLLPAPGQGALALECRASDVATRAALAALDHAGSRAAVTAERGLLAELEAGCAAPVGALAVVADGVLALSAVVLSVEGAATLEVHLTTPLGENPETLGRTAASDLLARGAADITPLGASRASRLGEFHGQALWAPGTHASLVGRRVLVPRADGPLAHALRAAGAEVDAIPVTSLRPLEFTLAKGSDWLVLTAPAGVRALTDAGIDLSQVADHIACVGPATADAVRAAGATVDLVPGRPSAVEELVAVFPDGPGSVVCAGSALARPALADGLRARGWDVTTVSTYTTDTLPVAPTGLPDVWPTYDAVLLTSGSVARALVALVGTPAPATRIVALGRPSAHVAREVGLPVHATAATPDGPGVLAALVAALEETR